MVGTPRAPRLRQLRRPLSAWRRWYSRLHPSLQLIGLQLWLPLFFIVMFCLCYIAAFHAPHPQQMPLALVGDDPALAQHLQQDLHGAVTVSSASSVAAAKAAVIDGSAAAAYDPHHDTLYVASAHQAQAALFAERIVSAFLVAAHSGTPAVVDLRPLPAWDSYGMTAMYLMLAWCIGGYMTAMFIGLMGAPLRHIVRVGVIISLGLLISLVTNVLAGPVIGAVQGHFFALTMMGWGWIVVIGLAVNGLSYFFGRFVALPSMVIFVFLSMPASGAAYPPWMIPEPFRWLNNVVVGSGITEMLKRELYQVGPGFARGLAMMSAYAAFGVVTMIVGKRTWERRRVRRVIRGRTTMFVDAQNANRDVLIAEREEILARHGLKKTATGTIRALEHVAHDDDVPAARDVVPSEAPTPFLVAEHGLEGDDELR